MEFAMRVFALLLGLALTSTATSPALADSFKQIKTEQEFRALVVNKKLVLGENHVTFRKNGTLKGNFGGKQLKGVWQWRDQYWCRTLTSPSESTDCQLFEINGNQLRGTRDRGKGKSFVYTIK